MEEKLDFKKLYRDLYLPKAKPMVITVPPILFMMTDGTGAPEGENYQQAISALYALSFTIKMSKMGGRQPAGYVEYVIPPLEGLWNGAGQGLNPDRDSWKWTSMLRQPDFVNEEVFRWAREEVRAKKPDVDVDRVRLAVYDEGLCVQMLHVGPYSTEETTLAVMSAFMEEQGLQDDCGEARRHHELYLGDPRRCAPDKLKTVLRHPVKRK